MLSEKEKKKKKRGRRKSEANKQAVNQQENLYGLADPKEMIFEVA